MPCDLWVPLLRNCQALKFKQKHVKQEIILVGCVPPAYQPYVFWWPPLGVGSRGDGYLRFHVQEWVPPAGTMSVGGWVPSPWAYTRPLDIRTHPLGYSPSDIPTPSDTPPPRTYPPHVDRLTDTCENITFPRLQLQVPKNVAYNLLRHQRPKLNIRSTYKTYKARLRYRSRFYL